MATNPNNADKSNDQELAKLQEEITAELLADESFTDFAEELAEAAKSSTLMTLSKEKLDESAVRMLSGILKKYDKLAPADRRTKILGGYDLPPTATDSALEAAVRKEISDSFESPIPTDLAQQMVTIIIDKARV